MLANNGCPVCRFPHSTFIWEGIDGSQVLAHFPPADTYNAHCTVEEFNKSTNNFKVLTNERHEIFKAILPLSRKAKEASPSCACMAMGTEEADRKWKCWNA